MMQNQECIVFEIPLKLGCSLYLVVLCFFPCSKWRRWFGIESLDLGCSLYLIVLCFFLHASWEGGWRWASRFRLFTIFDCFVFLSLQQAEKVVGVEALDLGCSLYLVVLCFFPCMQVEKVVGVEALDLGCSLYLVVLCFFPCIKWKRWLALRL